MNPFNSLGLAKKIGDLQHGWMHSATFLGLAQKELAFANKLGAMQQSWTAVGCDSIKIKIF